MSDEHEHEDCLTEDGALLLAYDALEEAKAEALAGRAAEASMLNQTAQLAIQLADRLRHVEPFFNPLATGTIQ